jgi:hypothetical protein
MKKLLLIITLLLVSVSCFAQPRYLLKVSEDSHFIRTETGWDNSLMVSEKLALDQIAAEITNDILFNTVIYKNEKLIYMAAKISFSNFGLLITSLSLPWEIMCASEGYTIDPELGKIKVLPKKFKDNKVDKFMMDGITFDFGRFQGDVKMESELGVEVRSIRIKPKE